MEMIEVASWICYRALIAVPVSILAWRMLKRRQGQKRGGALRPPPADQLLRLRVLGGCVGLILSTQMFPVLSPEEIPTQPLQLLPSLYDCFLGIFDGLKTGFEVWWKAGLFGLLNLMVAGDNKLPNDLAIQWIVAKCGKIISLFVSESFFHRYWFVLTPLLLSFLVSSLAVAGKSLAKLFPDLSKTVLKEFWLKRALYRAVFLICASLLLLRDSLELFLHKFLVGSFALGAPAITFILFAAEDLSIAKNVTKYTSSVLCLVASVLTLLSGHLLVSAPAYVCFWAVAVESSLVPRASLVLPQLLGMSLLPFALIYSSSLITKIWSISLCLIGLFAPRQITDSCESVSFAVLNYIFVRLPGKLSKFLLTKVLPLLKSIRRGTGKFLKQNLVQPLERFFRTTVTIMVEYVAQPLRSLCQWVADSVRRMLLWFGQLLAEYVWNPLKKLYGLLTDRLLPKVMAFVVKLFRGCRDNIWTPSKEMVMVVATKTYRQVLLPTGRFSQRLWSWVWEQFLGPTVRFCSTVISPLIPFYLSFLVSLELFEGFSMKNEQSSSFGLLFLLVKAMLFSGLQVVGYGVYDAFTRSGENGTWTKQLSRAVVIAAFVVTQAWHWTFFLFTTIRSSSFYGVFQIHTRACSDEALACVAALTQMFFMTSDELSRRFGLDEITWSDKLGVVVNLLFLSFAASSTLETWGKAGILPLGGLHGDWSMGKLHWLFRLWVSTQYGITAIRWFWARLEHRPMIRSITEYSRLRWIGLAGLTLCGACFSDLAGLMLSGVKVPSRLWFVQRTSIDFVLLAFGANCIGIQWQQLRFLRFMWVFLGSAARIVFRLGQPVIAYKFAVSMMFDAVVLDGWLSRFAFAIGSYTLFCVGTWLLGDVAQVRVLSIWGRNAFDYLGSAAEWTFSRLNEFAKNTSRFFGRLLSSLGGTLLNGSLLFWRHVVTPVLMRFKQWILHVWNHALSTWIVSAGVLGLLVAANRSGLDEWLLQSGHELAGLFKGMIGTMVGAASSKLGSTALVGSGAVFYLANQVTQEVGEWLVELENGTLAHSSAFAGLFASICILLSQLKVHRTQRQVLMQSRRIVFVVVFFLTGSIAFAPSLTRVTLGVSLVWASLAVVLGVLDERERMGVPGFLQRMRGIRPQPRATTVSFQQEIEPESDELTEHDQRVLNDLPDRSTIPTVFPADECIICMDSMEPADQKAATEPFTLICGHQFHAKCVAVWFRQQQRCPLCREPVTRSRQIIQSLF